MEEKRSNAPLLPAEAREFVERIVRKCSWRRGIRKEVRRELISHFEDALSEVSETRKDAIIHELINEFGDPALLAALIGRGKQRCQPWWARALVMSVKVTAVLLVFGVAVDVVLSKRSGEALQNEIARIRSTGAPTSAQDVIEHANKGLCANTLSKEERLKRCTATALLYDLSKLKIDLSAEVRGKQILELNRLDSILQLCEAGDVEAAAAVGETLSRNRGAIEKVRALAALSPDDPADTIWYQTQYAPETSGERGGARHYPVPMGEINLLAGPDVMAFVDAGSLMAVAAVRAIQEHKVDAALDDATTVMALSNHVIRTCPTLVGTMVAAAIRSMALTSIAQPLLNRADVSEDATARFAEMASRMDCAEAFAKSLAWERMFLLKGLDMIEDGKHIFAGADNSLFARLCRSPLDPLVLRARLFPFLHNEDAITALEFKNRLVEAAALPYPEYKARTSTWLDDLKKVPAWISPITKLGMAYLVNIKNDTTTSQANEDLALVAFALRRFKLAQGAYPDCLQALKPAFMSKLPVDRFSGESLLYRRQEEGCVIYSVSMNLRDDGGKDRGAEDNGAPDDLVWKLTR